MQTNLQSFKIDSGQPKNRKLIATKDIVQYEIILNASPILIAPAFTPENSEICFSCFQFSHMVYKCGRCKIFQYCSEECQVEDSATFHSKECEIYLQLEKKGFRLTSLFCLLIRSQIRTPIELKELFNPVEVMSEENKQFCMENALMVVNYLKLSPDEHFKPLFNIACSLLVNIFTIQDQLFQSEGIAIGCYYPANFINHHCDPNCIQLYDGKKQLIIANQNIQKGREINISYCDQPEKRKFLLQHYYFKCQCLNCDPKNNLNSIDTQVILSRYMNFLDAQDFVNALIQLEKYVNIQEKQNQFVKPILAWKYFELAKLYNLLNEPQKARAFAQKTNKILTSFSYAKRAYCPEFNDLQDFIKQIGN